MFEGTIDIKVLKDVVGAVAAVAEDAKLQLTSEGMSVVGVDMANVSLVDLKLPASAFESYALDGGAMDVGVAFERLRDLLTAAQHSGLVRMSIDDAKIRLGMGSLLYAMTRLDVAALRKEPKLPSLDFAARVSLNINDLVRTLKACSKVGDFVQIGVESGLFYIETEGETDKVRLDMGEEQLQGMDVTADVKSLYSLDYVSTLLHGLTFADVVDLEFGANYPLRLGATNVIKVSYLLAPRIDSD